ncbi:MAG TPA: beta-ribofuranosylaminobenzene 5'-phosphate synthase family protein [Vicinamibacterales bacterium]|nr:beta-ribofuranosylaminobenzene 5'-phosphate synthase family protein [Vicinamibacterales bacterium]
MTADTVFVEAAARLHFGVLDLRGARGRWFGGIGAAAPAPTLLVSARSAATVTVSGDDAERAAGFARAFLAHYGLNTGASISVLRALPAHAGLGSGTQLALAVARALAELHGTDATAAALSAAVGRGRRSAVGTWTFEGGGLVVEGGRRAGSDAIGPLIARLPFPRSWRCVVAVPRRAAAISGEDEAEALASLPPPADGEAEQIAHLVLMALLPALADGDLATFGRSLTAIQQVTGQWFAPVQGGAFARGPSEELVRHMVEWGASGVGQSSWGPAVYGVVDGDDAGTRLADCVRTALDRCGGGNVYEGAFRTEGARVWRSDRL